ncbi:MAG: succinylglutamate desuccinylase/aspartoacylase family protein [Planctomycetota bacterium]
MTSSTVAPPFEGRQFQRLTGRYAAGRPGPTVIVLAGIHGNEPAGVAAQQRVLRRLRDERAPLRGELVALAGNLGALRQGERYLRRDLNRQWTAAQVASLREQPRVDDAEEDIEQRELLEQFDAIVDQAQGPVLFLDLHTSSADGSPFVCLGDTLPNRDIALQLPIPVILGLEETIDGAVLEYFDERGLAGLAVEGGRHQAPTTVDNLEAAAWLVLVASGALPESAVTDIERHRATLVRAAQGAPPVVEIRYHHRIAPVDEFRMQPGYEGFQPVQRGELLASDQHGDVRAPETGRMLLPLYQGLGEDGFFLCRDVKPFWLGVARFMRKAHLHVLLPMLPGVRRHPDRRDALIANPRIARWLARELFHLLGYRHCRPEAGRFVFTRRRVAPKTWRLPWRD